jgi:hypothetical protein
MRQTLPRCPCCAAAAGTRRPCHPTWMLILMPSQIITSFKTLNLRYVRNFTVQWLYHTKQQLQAPLCRGRITILDTLQCAMAARMQPWQMVRTSARRA